MKKLKANQFLLIFIILTLCILGIGEFLEERSNKDNKTIITKADTITIIDSIEVIKPKPYYIHKTKNIVKDSIIYRDTIIYLPQKIDTLAILEDYFAIREYIDTFKVDSLNKIHYRALVFQNELQKIKLGYSLINTESTIMVPPKNRLEMYGGGMLGIGGGTYLNIQLKKSQSKWTYIGGVGKDLNNSSIYLFGVNYKIF